MIDVFIPLKGLLRIERLTTDNMVFRLHYRVTVFILVVSMLLITSKQLFGDPIHCFGNSVSNVAYKEAINDFCWMYGTFVITRHYDGQEGKHYAYPGVGPEPGDRLHISYYQWVFLVLMLQAIMFYLPHYLWKLWENGRMKALTQDLDGASASEDWSSGRRAELISCLTHSKLFAHNLYAVRFLFCEALNFVNVVLQIGALDWLLGGTFVSYGGALAAWSSPRDPLAPHPTSPADQRFPKLTKCTLRFYGASGDLQNRDLLCVLPVNVLNEKVFALLWAWFCILALVSGARLLIALVLSRCRRLRGLALRARARGTDLRALARASYGDWFVLSQLAANLDPRLYTDLLSHLAELAKERARTAA